jgi:hypothetical protein
MDTDTYSPEFSAYWQDEASPATVRDSGDAPAKQSTSATQEQALEELAERIVAARSVI